MGLFLTGTGTGIGKTWVCRGIARALVARGVGVAAVKPIETGCDTEPADALALGRACGDLSLASASGLYRARPPLAPYAATLQGESPPPEHQTLARRCHALADGRVLLVEGAGGLLVPLDRAHSMADFAQALAVPLVLVARDALGVLSHVLTASESAEARGLPIAAIVLTRTDDDAQDDSTQSNRRILEERVDAPVLAFPRCEDDDDALAAAAEASGLVTLVR